MKNRKHTGALTPQEIEMRRRMAAFHKHIKATGGIKQFCVQNNLPYLETHRDLTSITRWPRERLVELLEEFEAGEK